MKFLFVFSFACLAGLFFINYCNKPEVKSLTTDIEPVFSFPEDSNQLIDSITQSLKRPQTERIDDITNDDYIVECESKSLIKEEGNIESQQQYLKSLYNSTSQDRRLEYALYAELPEDKSKRDLLLEYNEEFPNNPLVMMEALHLCNNSSKNKCDKNFVDTAIASDKNNGAMWLQSVFYFASQGNDEDIVKSISGLVKTSLFNERHGERIRRYAQALAGSSIPDFYTNVASGIGIEAARAAGYSHIVSWCRKGRDDIEKANACLSLGRNLEKRSKILLSQLVGIAIQNLIHEAVGNTELIQLLEIKKEQLKKYWMSEQFMKASSLMFHDEKLLRNWLNNLDEIGEVESLNVLIEEAISLSQTKGLSLCTH